MQPSPRPRLLRSRLAAALLLAVTAPAPAADTAPVWTLVPTRIDRNAETRERIVPPPPKPEGAIRLTVERPIRLGPDGSFAADGRQVRLFGIVLPPLQKLCEPSGGGRWACGTRANAYFRLLIGGKPLTCHRHNAPEEDILIADCSAGREDIATRLLREGWATTDLLADDSMKAAEAEARASGRGLWLDHMPDF